MIIQNEFNLYPSNMLPERFCYPEKYVRISNDTSLIPYIQLHNFHWWFENYGTEGAEVAYIFRNSILPDLNLIPFASNGEWEAYFDGNDVTGNPRVIVINLDNIENHEFFNSFEEWFELAIKDTW